MAKLTIGKFYAIDLLRARDKEKNLTFMYLGPSAHDRVRFLVCGEYNDLSMRNYINENILTCARTINFVNWLQEVKC